MRIRFSEKAGAKVPILLELGNWRPWISLTVWALVGEIVLLPLGNLIYKTGATVVAGDSSLCAAGRHGRRLRSRS